MPALKHNLGVPARLPNSKNNPLYYKLLSQLPEQREKRRVYNHRRAEEIRSKCFALFGNTCECCGFSDMRALQIDHINGDRDKRVCNGPFGTYWQVLHDSNWRKKYQLLCANCHTIKTKENKDYLRKVRA